MFKKIQSDPETIADIPEVESYSDTNIKTPSKAEIPKAIQNSTP